MTIFAPTNTGLRSKGPTGYQAANAEAERRRAEQAARDADPVEQAVLFIRRRGRVIFRANVEGGPEGMWKYGSQLLDGAAVMALADQLRGLARHTLPPPPQPRGDEPPPSPIIFGRPKAPTSSPAHHPRATSATASETPLADPTVATPSAQTPGFACQLKEETAMGHQFKPKPQEEINCEERGTTTAQVKRDLAALRDVLGTGGAADRLGVGRSSVGNIIGGHAVVGPTILTALYGETGCQLRPSLAALLGRDPAPEVASSPSGEKPVELPPAAAKVEEPMSEAGDITYRDGLAAKDLAPADETVVSNVMNAVIADAAPEPAQIDLAAMARAIGNLMHGAPSNLASITAADLLANAERRRAQLRAELAEIDQQIRAVLQLSQVAA